MHRKREAVVRMSDEHSGTLLHRQEVSGDLNVVLK